MNGLEEFIEWKTLWTGLAGMLLGGILTRLAGSAMEMRRKIRFSAPHVYFGPALTENQFMGVNYPAEDLIGFECEIRFFSEKSETIGLHEFQLEFCKMKYFRTIVEFRPEMHHVLPDIGNEATPYSLKTLEIPVRKFVSVNLRTHFERKDWPSFRSCSCVRLTCKTSDGKRKHFNIGRIQMPEMPPEGVRGVEYMSLQVTRRHRAKSGKTTTPDIVIMASRRRRDVQTNFFTAPTQQDVRFWDGEGWVNSEDRARVYRDQKDARKDGERVKIWNIVPQEWMQTEE